jgi:hypothetical protein
VSRRSIIILHDRDERQFGYDYLLNEVSRECDRVQEREQTTRHNAVLAFSLLRFKVQKKHGEMTDSSPKKK